MTLGGLTKATGVLTSKVLANTANDMKKGIDRHGGLAKTNRFSIFFKTPEYNLFNQNAASIAYGLSGGNLQSFFDDVRDVGILCEGVTLPASNLRTFEYSDIRNTQTLPNGFTNTEFSINFTVTNDYFIPRMFKVWENSIINRKTNRLNFRNSYARDIYVIGCDDNNIPNYVIKIIKAFPIRQSEIVYSENEMNSNIKYKVTFAYEDFEERGVNDVFGDISDIIEVGINKFNSVLPFIQEGNIDSISDYANYLKRESNVVENYENSFIKRLVGKF